MKKTFIHTFILASAMSLIFSCSSKVEDVSPIVQGLGGEVLAKQPIDAWLETNFLKPYNIEVRYRWDANELPNKILVPPLLSKVQPVMEGVKAIWIDPYEKEAGSDFIKKFCPKQYVLVGSANWNTDGTIVLGTAEGGRKVVLYQINEFDKKNVDGVKQMLHTIHHEFAHILQQNVVPDVAYKRITPGSYTSNWYNVSDSEALAAGYITPYSMLNADEDFVEILATMLVEGKTAYDARVNSANTTARTALRRKEQIVKDYLKNAYKIDFDRLQTSTQTAIANFTR
jgi:substrate import-associated zinc metallohydrolase lipoprotein